MDPIKLTSDEWPAESGSLGFVYVTIYLLLFKLVRPIFFFFLLKRSDSDLTPEHSKKLRLDSFVNLIMCGKSNNSSVASKIFELV